MEIKAKDVDVKVFIKNPNFLDTEKVEISLLNVNENFVEHPQYPNYFISNFGRVISTKRKNHKLLEPQLVGNEKAGGMRYGFRLCDSDGNWKNAKRAILVANIFCFNPSPDNTQMVVHHINGNQLDDKATNLEYLTYEQHGMIHLSSKLYTYDINTEILTEYNSIQALADFLKTGKKKLVSKIKAASVLCTIKNGTINLVNLHEISASGIYVGYNKAFIDNAESESYSVSFLDLLIGGVAGYALGKLIKEAS